MCCSAPVGTLVPPTLEALDRGGTLSIAGIHLTDVPQLNYAATCSRSGRSPAPPRTPPADAREFLGFAAAHKLAVTVHPYPLDAADRALRDLEAGAFDGAAVLVP